MEHVLNVLKLVMSTLNVAWEMANDPQIEADIEAIQKDVRKLLDRVQVDIDREKQLGADEE